MRGTRRLIDLLHTRSFLTHATRCTTGTTSTSTREAARSSTSSTLEFLHDRIGNPLKLLLILLVLLLRALLRSIEPRDGIIDSLNVHYFQEVIAPLRSLEVSHCKTNNK